MLDLKNTFLLKQTHLKSAYVTRNENLYYLYYLMDFSSIKKINFKVICQIFF